MVPALALIAQGLLSLLSTTVHQPRQPAMLAIPTLPAELIVAILEYTYFTDPRLPAAELDRKSIIACSRVSRAWSLPALALLFRNVKLTSKPLLHAFQAATDPSTERGRFLGRAVRSLAIEPGRASVTFSDLVSTLAACPLLHELDLTMSISDPLPQDTIECFSAVASSVKILHLNYRNMPAAVTQVLAACPSVEFLELRGSVGVQESLVSLRPAFKLAELQFRVPFFCSEDQASCDMLDWILTNSTESLSILTLVDMPSDPALCKLITAHGPTLRSLRLASYNPERAVQYVTAIRGCPRLEELQLNFNPGPDVLEAIPRTLEHLSFKNDERSMFDVTWDHSISRVIEAVPTFPRLRVITYVADKRIDNPERQTLKEKCDAKRVHLSCVKKQLGFFPGEVRFYYYFLLRVNTESDWIFFELFRANNSLDRYNSLATFLSRWPNARTTRYKR